MGSKGSSTLLNNRPNPIRTALQHVASSKDNQPDRDICRLAYHVFIGHAKETRVDSQDDNRSSQRHEVLECETYDDGIQSMEDEVYLIQATSVWKSDVQDEHVKGSLEQYLKYRPGYLQCTLVGRTCSSLEGGAHFDVQLTHD